MKEKEINKIATEFLNMRKGCIPRTDMSLKKLLVEFYDYAWEHMTNDIECVKPKQKRANSNSKWEIFKTLNSGEWNR